MGTSSYSSTIRNGGRPLRLAYPIHGKNTFKPSGQPDDPDDVPSDSGYQSRTREEPRRWDNFMRGSSTFAGSLEEGHYWDRVRYLKTLSPRARKRALAREDKGRPRTSNVSPPRS